MLNGIAIFELHLLLTSRSHGGKGRLEEMDRCYDGYAWTKIAMSNITDDGAGLQFKYL